MKAHDLLANLEGMLMAYADASEEAGDRMRAAWVRTELDRHRLFTVVMVLQQEFRYGRATVPDLDNLLHDEDPNEPPLE